MKEKIEQMFNSSDKELIRLARLMCHQYRLDYYVQIAIKFAMPIYGRLGIGRIVYIPIRYSLHDIGLNRTHNLVVGDVHHIKLRGNV